LIDRPVIKKDFDSNYWVVVHTMDAELNRVKQLYDEQMTRRAETGSMPINKNLPPVAGALKWSQELRDRMAVPMADFRRLEHPYVSTSVYASCIIKSRPLFQSRRLLT
jgi:dynein heavy chain, axonemal